MTPRPRPWYMIQGGRFDGDEPFFYDPNDFAWVTALESGWQTIADELQQLLRTQEQERLKPYFHQEMAFPSRHWKTLGFYFWQYRIHKNCRDCPETTRILESIPGMTAGSLSILEPGSNINPHQGDTNAIVRVHLGLSIPDALPDCGFQVGDQIRPWQDGKALLFCDAHTHSAWNHTSERRLILIVDILRPEFADQADAICSHVLASTFLQVLYQRFPWLGRLPGKIRGPLHGFSRLCIRMLLPLQRRLGFLV